MIPWGTRVETLVRGGLAKGLVESGGVDQLPVSIICSSWCQLYCAEEERDCLKQITGSALAPRASNLVAPSSDRIRNCFINWMYQLSSLSTRSCCLDTQNDSSNAIQKSSTLVKIFRKEAQDHPSGLEQPFHSRRLGSRFTDTL